MIFKKILILLIFAIAIIGIITPVEAKLSVFDLYDGGSKKGKTDMYLQVYSHIYDKTNDDTNWIKYASKRKVELNKVNKAVISVNGYRPITFKKPTKGWKIETWEGYSASKFSKKISLKGNAVGNTYSIKLYDKKGKIIINKKYIIWSLNERTIM